METLEFCRLCRLCGNQSEIAINIFDKKGAIINKIHTMLPIAVHEMDSLPKQMCHRCSYKLEEFHKFYLQCIRTDEHLKSQLSWMKKDKTDKVVTPMVFMGNLKIKSEPIDVDSLDDSMLNSNMPFINRFTFNSNRCLFPNGSICPTYYGGQIFVTQPFQTNPKEALIQPTEVLVPDVPDNSRLPSREDYADTSNSRNAEKTKVFETNTPPKDIRTLPDPRSVKENILARLNESANSDTWKPRILRPRRNSVDYVLNKRKTSNGLRSRSESGQLLPETPGKLQLSEPMKKFDTSRSAANAEIVSRVLRPRKTNLNYQPVTRRKLPADLQADTKPKRSRYSYSAVIKIKKEFRDDDYSPKITLNKLQENKLQKDNFTKSTLQSEHSKCTKNSQNKIKIENPCLSPISLRSQNVRSRNGKITINLSNDLSDKTLRSKVNRTDVKIKQFCEKCNICYYNRRHKCVSD